MSAKESLKTIGKRITPAYIAKVAVLTGIAFILYAFVKFPLPFMFPVFLEMQFSELPAILAGFSLGPVAGTLVIILKCLLYLPMSQYKIGVFTDMLLGIVYVLPASLIYHRNKSKKTALIGLIVGTVAEVVAAIFVNAFITIPVFQKLYGWGALIGLCAALFKNISQSNFYLIYLSAAALPFNVLRMAIVSLITFFVYKHISKILHWEIKKKEENNEEPTSESDREMQTKQEDPILETKGNEDTDENQ